MFTVFGASGFIGGQLSKTLSAQGHAVYAPARDDDSVFRRSLGHVFYCIGLTADFRSRPFDTVEAHVTVLLDLMRYAKFDSFLYLSSTRLYQGSARTDEDAPMLVHSGAPSDLYNITKIAGEATCLAHSNPRVRIARLSNVYGVDFRSDNFLTSVFRDAVLRKSVTLQNGLESEKDYIDVRDVISLLPRISQHGSKRVYNLASGENVSHAEIMKKLMEITGCSLECSPNSPAIKFAPINIDRLRSEFPVFPRSITKSISELVYAFQKEGPV